MPTSSDAVSRKKFELLRTPVSAYATALNTAQHALEKGWDAEVRDTYLAVAEELEKEGYKPLPDGSPGPATVAYYKKEAEGNTKSRDLPAEIK